jgi:hypothetical protein
MKHLNKIIAGLAIITIGYACSKEIPPIGLQLTDPISFNDTTFVLTTLPAPQAKAVFVEEFTGVKCSNCPAGAYIIKQFQNNNPGRVIVAKLHNNILASPIKPADPDLRAPEADDIANGFGGLSSKPAAIIDRVDNTSVTPSIKFFKVKEAWGGVITAQLAKSTPVNIDLSQVYVTDSAKHLVTVSFTYTQPDSTPLAFTAYLLENKVAATQDSIDANFNTVEIEEYEHEEVFRQSITTPVLGNTLPKDNNTAGRVYRRSFYITLPPSTIVNSNNLSVCVALHKVNKGEVLHAAEIKLVK